MRHRSLTAALAVVGMLVLAGCGLQTGDSGAGAELVVTRGYGTSALQDGVHSAGGSALALLRRNARVRTGPQDTVSAVDGVPGRWHVYVNGVRTSAATGTHDGDTVWWDRQAAPAVVGAFPEPFDHGIDGRKLPVRVECLDTGDASCNTVQKKLVSVGVLAAKGGVQTSFTKETLRVLVGPYKALRDDATVGILEKGPRVSGVFAQPTPDGSIIDVLHPDGSVAERLGADSGLVAATRLQTGQPVWIVTGTDAAGVAAAASTLDEGTLKDHFALAISHDRGLSVPAA